MMSTWKNRVQRWRSAEAGVSEVAGAIFVLPLIAFILFALVEAGVYFHYRTSVDNIVDQAAKGFANDGGDRFMRTLRVSASGSTVVTPTKPNGGAYSVAEFTWSKWGSDSLQQLCGTPGDSYRCQGGQPPRVVCETPNPISGSGSVNVARQPYAEVKCTATFPYEPVSPLSKNPLTSLGLSGLFTRPITMTAITLTKTGAVES
jgi:hypothetical protein